MTDSIESTVTDRGMSMVFPSKGFVPPGMRLTVEQLATLMGISPKTLAEWNRKYQLPVRSPGNADWIDTDEWWAALPRKKYGDDATG